MMASSTAILRLLRILPAYPIFGDGRARLQPGHADDVAAAVTQVLRQSKRPNPVYELAGPRVYSYEELVRTVARSAGLRRVLMPAPFSFWGALAGLAEILPHPPHPQPGRVYTDRHYGLRQLAGIRQARNFAAFARRRTRSNAQSKSNDESQLPIPREHELDA